MSDVQELLILWLASLQVGPGLALLKHDCNVWRVVRVNKKRLVSSWQQHFLGPY